MPCGRVAASLSARLDLAGSSPYLQLSFTESSAAIDVATKRCLEHCFNDGTATKPSRFASDTLDIGSDLEFQLQYSQFFAIDSIIAAIAQGCRSWPGSCSDSGRYCLGCYCQQSITASISQQVWSWN